MNTYTKAIIALLTAGAIAAQTALADGAISPTEWTSIAISALGAIAVYAVPNKHPPTPDAPGRHELREDT
ncbi:MAG: hypothetical protein ACRD3Q_04425 [Terriglobales bacterium]